MVLTALCIIFTLVLFIIWYMCYYLKKVEPKCFQAAIIENPRTDNIIVLNGEKHERLFVPRTWRVTNMLLTHEYLSFTPILPFETTVPITWKAVYYPNTASNFSIKKAGLTHLALNNKLEEMVQSAALQATTNALADFVIESYDQFLSLRENHWFMDYLGFEFSRMLSDTGYTGVIETEFPTK